MKSLYDENGRYTKAGNDLQNGVLDRIHGLLDSYDTKGYDFRQISHLAGKAVLDWELTRALTPREEANGT
jgi:hypothetical protein